MTRYRFNRLSWLLICFGIAGVLIGITIPSFGMGDAGQFDPDELRGRIYFVVGDVNVDITVNEGGPISFYVLDWNNSMELVRTQSLKTIDSIFVLENITHFEGIITIPVSGLYSFISQNMDNESVAFRVDMSRVLPQRHIFYPSVLVTTIGMILFQAVRTPRSPLKEL
ncbi:MAG: hypothetical protein EAX81_08400 [Candidatus Thorarchaeota archaeon]|nr:hypothetical protein [Candidatus Thorarchaeota archaeon]